MGGHLIELGQRSGARARLRAYLWAALIGAAIGTVLMLLPMANAWVPIWAAALDPAVSTPPAAELYRMEPDGSRQTRLTITAADERSPAVSPDGTRVAVKLWPTEVDGPQVLAVIDLRTGERLDLVSEGLVNQPSWSPDGERVLFGWQREGRSDLQLWWAPSDGSGQPVRLIDDEEDSLAGQWSPDGRQLLFASDRDGFGLYVANADGTDIEKIVDAPRYADASWSPDSRLIAFTSDEEGAFGLSVVARDGLGLRVVKQFAGAILLPDWSPDGRTLVFESHQSGDGEIGSVSIDGTNERNLTRNPGVTDGMGGPTVAGDGSIIYAAAANQAAAFIALVRERVGTAALTTQSLLLAIGAALLFVGGRVAVGAVTPMVTAAAAMGLGWWGAWAFFPAAIVAAIAADIVNWALRGRAPRAHRAATVGTLTMMYVAGHLATVDSTRFLDWPAGWWPGESWDAPGVGFPPETVVLLLALAAGIGVLVGFLSRGPASPSATDTANR